jgi:uncharacterized protein
MEPERIEFPADYPIKVVARANEGLRLQLDAIFLRHFGPFAVTQVQQRDSGRQNYVAYTYVMRADSEQQLQALHLDLKAVEGVIMVL